MNDLTPLSPHSASFNRSPVASAMALELMKIMKLVAPVSMTEEAHLSWLATAVDALADIRVAEVEAVSMEVRRSVTRVSQIIPEIAKLVSEKRARANRTSQPPSPFAAELAINREAQERRAKAHTAAQMEAAADWEHGARKAAGLSYLPRQAPLSRFELDNMNAATREMGIKTGFLKRDGNRVIEVTDFTEMDRIREENKRAKSTP